MGKLRIGILGTGAIVREFHLPVLLENPRVKVTAVGNLHQASLTELAKGFGIKKTYTNFHLMAKDLDVDAVVIALPNYLHASVAIEMLQNGKHVLCEKPMAMTFEEAQAMVESAEYSNRKLMIAHVWRSDREIRWLREVVNSGTLGSIFKVNAHSVLAGGGPSPTSWFVDPELAGGGALADIGIHTIDTISFLFNDTLRPETVWAQTGNHFGQANVEDTATALIKYDNGMVATIEAGWHHVYSNNPHGALEVFGNNGYGRVFPSEMYSKVEGAWGWYRPSTIQKKQHIDREMYAAQTDHFLDCILNDQKPICDGRQGMRAMAVLEAAYRSARIGASVSIRQN